MRLTLLLLMVPTAASAAGFYMSDNGSKSLMMGGAFAGQADDLTAIAYNPAGLAQLNGFQFALDGQLITHDITFQRYDPGFDPAAPPNTPANSVSNQGGPFLLPLVALGYGLKILDRQLTIALGVYGPPSNGHYAYPAPNYTQDAMGKYAENPRKFAPQRYALVDNNILIVFPTLSIGFAPHPKFSLGISLQPVLGTFSFNQAVTSITRVGITPMRQADEDPLFDSMVHVNLPWQLLNFTVVAGAMVKPTDWLQFGVSFRPQVQINAKGKLGIDLGRAATQLNTVVTGDDVTLSLQLPAELKVGVHVQPMSKLGINFDFVYQGWQSVQEIVLDPQNVSLTMGTSEPTKVVPFRIQKHWKNSYQFRLGAAYALFPWLALHLGGWYETGAIPDEYIGVDFLHFDRFFLTGGVGVRFGPIEVMLGAAGSPSMSHAVTQSLAVAGSTEPEPAGVIGAGVYTSGNFMATIGVRGNFGGWPGAAPTPPKEEPTPEPAQTPAPAAAPATDAPAPAPVNDTPTDNTEAPKS